GLRPSFSRLGTRVLKIPIGVRIKRTATNRPSRCKEFQVFELLQKRRYGAGAVTDSILFPRFQLGVGSAQLGEQEDGIITEALGSAGVQRNLSPAFSFRFHDQRAVLCQSQ